jgi:hypothetical protein
MSRCGLHAIPAGAGAGKVIVTVSDVDRPNGRRL